MQNVGLSVTIDSQPVPQRPPDEACLNCGAVIPGIGSFCPNCGALKPSLRHQGAVFPSGYLGLPQRPYQYQTTRRAPQWRSVLKAVMSYTMITYLIYQLVMLIALIYGISIVLPAVDGIHYPVYIIAPILIHIFTLTGGALAIYYILIVIAISLSAAWLYITGFKGFAEELSMTAKSRQHSKIFDLCGLFFGVLFLDMIVALLLLAGGRTPIDPTNTSEPSELLFYLANASVWEELVVRVLLIGLPLILIDLVRGRLREHKYSYILGGGFNIGIPEIVLIIVSSSVFGYAHLSDYGSWKVFPAAVAGLAFAYMFLRHGLGGAIMLHFAFDYLGMPGTAFGSSSGMDALLGLALLLWIGLGFIFFVYYLVRIGEFLTGRLFMEERPTLAGAPSFPYGSSIYYGSPAQPGTGSPGSIPYQESTAPAMQTPTPPMFGRGWTCPQCGHHEARWVEGKFQCLRCGHLS